MDDAAVNLIVLVIIGGVFAFIMWAIVRSLAHLKRVSALVAELERAHALICLPPEEVRYRLDAPGSASLSLWKHGLLAVLDSQVILFPRTQKMESRFVFPIDTLRWFGRPQKYQPGDNDMWLHLEHDGRWELLKIRLSQHHMLAFVRTLKEIATPEQVIAYRRQRPYVHFGPLEARPATQDLYGAWTLSPAIELYLTPSFLVVLDSGKVMRALPLEQVQQIGALHRLDAPDADGLVRFEFTWNRQAELVRQIPKLNEVQQGETFAFALKDHEGFASALAEAAKRTLEAPLIRKGKEKGDEFEDEELMEEAI
jgi:hypothetical protein